MCLALSDPTHVFNSEWVACMECAWDPSAPRVSPSNPLAVGALCGDHKAAEWCLVLLTETAPPHSRSRACEDANPSRLRHDVGGMNTCRAPLQYDGGVVEWGWLSGADERVSLGVRGSPTPDGDSSG
jgi:hypothetical protein